MATTKEKVKSFIGSAQAKTDYYWDKIAYGINFEWLSTSKKFSAILLAVMFVALSLTVGLTALPVKNGVTLGVEFGGGYELRYLATQKPGGPNVTYDTMSAQANSMYKSCVNNGHSNCVVQFFMPDSFNVIIPGVSTDAEVQPVLDAFAQEPLALTLKFSLSLSGVLGSEDLKATVTAAAIAFGIVWGVLVLRYHAAGLVGLYLTIVFLWLLMVFFNASTSVLSEAAIVAIVLNIGIAADSHILTYERIREELHALPIDVDIDQALKSFLFATRTSLVTILEANITTLLAMVVLYGVSVGSTTDFAFMVIISVCTSLLINVTFSRFILRLSWNAGIIKTGGFFGDKGPAYDEIEAKKWYKTNHYWTPGRSVPINWVRYWWVGLLASAAVITAGCVYLGNQQDHPLNLDIDFTRGTALDLQMPPNAKFTCEGVAGISEDSSGKGVATFACGSGGKVALRFDDVLSTSSVQKIVVALEHRFKGNVTFEENTVDPTVANETLHKSIIAIVVSAIVVDIFVFLRFGFAFAAAAFFCMASSAVYSLCCFALGAFEIDVTFVAAVLTVFAYAVNDCVVVFDRIRFEHRAATTATGEVNTPERLRSVVNLALSRVCIRSLLTLAMVMICSIMMVFKGAEPLRAFSLAITFGLLSATYTTLLIAAPMYYYLILFGWMIQSTSCCNGKASNQKSVAENDDVEAPLSTQVEQSSSTIDTVDNHVFEPSMTKVGNPETSTQV